MKAFADIFLSNVYLVNQDQWIFLDSVIKILLDQQVQSWQSLLRQRDFKQFLLMSHKKKKKSLWSCCVWSNNQQINTVLHSKSSDFKKAPPREVDFMKRSAVFSTSVLDTVCLLTPMHLTIKSATSLRSFTTGYLGCVDRI